MKTRPSLPFVLSGFVVSILVAAICTAVGRADFLLDTDIAARFLIAVFDTKDKLGLLTGAVLWITYIPLIHIPARSFNRKTWAITIALYPAFVIMSIHGGFWPPMILALLMAIALRGETKFRNTLILFIEICAISFLYEVATGYIKTGFLPHNVEGMDEYGKILLSADYVVFLGVLYMYYYKKRGEENAGIYMVLRRTICLRRDRPKAQKCNSKSFHAVTLSKLDRTIMYAMQPAQLILVVLATSINNRHIVFLVFFLAGYLPQRLHKDHTIAYHAPTWYGCMLQTIISFYVVCAAFPVQNVSFLAPALGGAVFWWLTVRVAMLQSGKPSIETLEKETLARLIALAPMKDEYRCILSMSWLDGMTVEKIAESVPCSVSQANKVRKVGREWIESNL